MSQDKGLVTVYVVTDDSGNHGFAYKIFLAPSANALNSPATGCDIVPTDASGASSIPLAVVDQPLLYNDNACWSSTYGS